MKLIYNLLLSSALLLAGSVLSAQDLGITLSDETASEGQVVCVDMIGENFSDLSGLQFTISYDPAALRFSSSQARINDVPVQIVEPASTPGVIRVTWNLIATTGFTSAAGPFDFGDLCFVVLRGGTSAITIVDSPVPIEFTQADETILDDFTLVGATITGRAATCDDGVRNGGETGRDCGGPNCEPCVVIPPTCDDGRRNGNETGVDCGGPDCEPCAVVTPTCSDGVRNGDETGVDCGGSCAPCASVCGEGTDAVTVCVGEVCADAGAEICVPIFVGNFNQLTGFNFNLTYDSDNLSNPVVRPASQLELGTQSSLPEEEIITIVYNDLNATGVTFPADRPAFELCFTAVTTNATPITFDDPDENLRVFDDLGAQVDAESNPGSINGAGCNNNQPTCSDGVQNGNETGVDCGGSCAPCGDEPAVCGEGSNDINFCIGESCDVAVGTQTCVDVTVANFDNVTGFQFDLLYDGAQLDYQSVTFNPDLDNSIPASEFSDGVVRLIYIDLDQSGESLSDGEIAVTVCFTNEGTAGTSLTGGGEILASNTSGTTTSVVNPGRINGCGGNMPTCNDGVRNGNETGVDCGGSCAPCDDEPAVCGEGSDDINFCIGETCNVAVGEQACVEITGTNFDNVTSFQFDLLYDGTQLDFESATYNPSLENSFPANEASDSVVRLIYSDLDLRGESLPDGAVVITVCFTNEGTTGTELTGGGQILASNTSGTTTSIVNPGRINGCDGMVSCDNFEIAITALPVTCSGAADGAVQIVTLGGTAPYNITLNGTATDGELIVTNLAPGNYAVTVTDANGCTADVTVSVPTPEPIAVTGIVTSTADGVAAINIDVMGGEGELMYAWSGPGGFSADTEDLSGLTTPGQYEVIVTGVNGCTASARFVVTAVGADLTLGEVTATNASCAGGNGQVAINLVGGVAPFTVVTTPGDDSRQFNGSLITLDLGAGAYSFTVTDANGMTVTAAATVGEPSAIAATSTFVSDVEGDSCVGTITLSPSGGTGDYSVRWSSGETTEALVGICAGTYSATVTDANGCTFVTEDVTIGRVEEDLVSVTDVDCDDSTDGAIDVSITGGVTPYTFSWVATGASDVLSTDEDLSGAGPGGYTLTATDATGAALVRSYNISQSSGFSIDSLIVSDFNGFNISCAGGNDGRIESVVAGQGLFTYEYFRGEELLGADSVLIDLSAGEYTVRVTGPGGCESTRSVTLTEPTALSATATVEDSSCDGVEDGRVTVTPAGGVGPYSFTWFDDSDSSVVSDLAPGDYAVTVTDANGCTSVESFTVGEPEDLIVTLETTDATEGCNGTIQVLPLGGSGSYTITYQEAPDQNDEVLATGLCPGVYTVIVADSNGCQTVTMMATVEDRRAPCLSTRAVITPNGDGLNESLIIFCSGDDIAASNNNLQVFNRWGQLVFERDDYQCSEDGDASCFEGRTNDGDLLPEGAYFYVFDYGTAVGQREQQRGSFTLIRE